MENTFHADLYDRYMPKSSAVSRKRDHRCELHDSDFCCAHLLTDVDADEYEQASEDWRKAAGWAADVDATGSSAVDKPRGKRTTRPVHRYSPAFETSYSQQLRRPHEATGSRRRPISPGASITSASSSRPLSTSERTTPDSARPARSSQPPEQSSTLTRQSRPERSTATSTSEANVEAWFEGIDAAEQPFWDVLGASLPQLLDGSLPPQDLAALLGQVYQIWLCFIRSSRSDPRAYTHREP
jgi:hypothetical protein